MQRQPNAVAVALRHGAPARRVVVRAVLAGAAANLLGVALLGGAAGLLTWSATRPGLATVAGLLVLVELVAFLRAPIRHAERVAAHDLGLDGLAGWRTWLLDAVATWSPSRLAAARAGDLLVRCIEDTDLLQDLWVRVLVPAGSAAIALLTAALVLGVLDPLAGIALFAATVLVAGATWDRARRVALLGQLEAEAKGIVAARTVEFTRGADALRLLGADGAHRAATDSLLQRADRLGAKRDATVSKLGILAAVLGACTMVAAIGGMGLPTSNPSLLAGVALATFACIALLVALSSTLDALGHVAGAAQRLADLPSAAWTGTELARPGALEMAHVDVSVAADGPLLLRDVVLEVAPATTIAVTGPTGVGKSALLAVAAGLEAPRGGTVRLSGAALDTLAELSLRREVAWLPTLPSLLEGRVRDVLDVGRGLGDDALFAALDAVGLTSALASRGGLEAVVGERETDLSAGERRRLALARLLAGSPSVYVLDEPTAGLDDHAVDAALDAVLSTGAAVLIATHDLRVLGRATHAVTLADGRLT